MADSALAPQESAGTVAADNATSSREGGRGTSGAHGQGARATAERRLSLDGATAEPSSGGALRPQSDADMLERGLLGASASPEAAACKDEAVDNSPRPRKEKEGAPCSEPLRRCREIGVSWTDISFEARVRRPRTGILGTPPLCDVLNALDSLTQKGPLKKILCGVSGEVLPGDMVALMGASGAGKSTLLNILSRYLRETSGTVKYGDAQLELKEAKKVSCFIQQEDLFNGFITVREHLQCIVRLRTTLPPKEREALVDRLLVAFELSKAADTCIGNLQMGARRGISGGEKKRLSVATEIVTNPSIIFADEPTTGLDSFMAEAVMTVLERLAQNGRSIICTIHQPSTTVFEKFNKVILLAEGRMVFAGDRLALRVYFARVGKSIPPYTSVADFVIDVLSSSEGAEATLQIAEKMHAAWINTGVPFMRDWHESLREQYIQRLQSEGVADKLSSFKGETKRLALRKEALEAPTATDEEPGLKKKEAAVEGRVSWWTQFQVLLHRRSLANKRNPQILQARVGQTLVSALLLGFIFLRLRKGDAISKNGAANFINLNQGMTGLVTVLQTFTTDKIVALREYRSGTYSLVPYFLAKTAADAAFQIFNPVVFFTIAWYMMNLNPSATRWLWGLGFIFLQTNASISMGYLISCMCPDLEIALSVMPLLTMPLILVAGFMIILDSLPRFWIWVPYLSPFRWAFSGIMHAVWEDVELDPCPAGMNPPSCYSSGAEVLEYYCLDGDSMWLNALYLVIMVVGYRVVGLLVLLILNRRN
uniref:ATP-binding cassette transporter G family ABCG-84 protein n=1 Tax=Toxoplasma gondii TaxID=5811 RepID=D3XD37_TOXGO|nr:ATP-binding cassette transporter G family ABCG-84 protein [Toxoplasma gondii]